MPVTAGSAAAGAATTPQTYHPMWAGSGIFLLAATRRRLARPAAAAAVLVVIVAAARQRLLRAADRATDLLRGATLLQVADGLAEVLAALLVEVEAVGRLR